VRPLPLPSKCFANDRPRRETQNRSSEMRHPMKPSTSDKARGTFHEVKGTVKQKVGRALHKPGLQAEGQVEKIGGKIQKKLGQVERALEN
jgi:uncharacterized protein YjbJ (UPF0337 family)